MNQQATHTAATQRQAATARPSVPIPPAPEALPPRPLERGLGGEVAEAVPPRPLERGLGGEVAEAAEAGSRSGSRLYWPKTLAGAPRYIFDGAAPTLRPAFLPDFTRQPSDLWHKVLKFLFVGRIPIGPKMAAWLTGFDGWKELKRVRPTDRFMADGVTNPRTLQAIAWMLPRQTRKFNYFNNCLRFALPGKDINALMSRMKQMGYTLATFDPDDAHRYGLQLTEQFYRTPTPDEKPSTHEPVDCFFCGENKGRRAELEALQQQLEAAGLSTCFVIADSPSERISYEDYLQHVATCRCIIDWVQAGQRGLTRRPVEALFWQKKLITNCRALAEANSCPPHPDNIFIIGRDDPAQLYHFVNSPLHPASEAVRQRYHVDHWLHYFE